MTDGQNRPPRAFFYVQHLLGIGHLARASRIARALAEDGFDVTVVTGGTPVTGFPGPLVHHVALPPITAGDAGFSGLADIDGKPVDDAFKENRKERLLAAFRQSQPDIVIIEAFPFGRRQVRFELLPLLDTIAAMDRKPLVVTSLRDILQERSKPGRDEETVALVKQYFDRVLVHGDPAFARLEDTFPLAAEITGKVIYTGLVAAPAPAQPTECFDVIVSAGGGAVGNALIRAALEAAKSIGKPLSWALITGPNLPQPDFDAILADAPAQVSVYRFRPDFASLLAGARLSVSQAGYNTVCDILRAGCHALLIPFTAGGETEQTVRAERLEKLGLAHVLTEDDLSADSMTRAIDKALAATDRPPHSLDLDGAHRTAEILRGLI
ncbi:glycosyl transferase [Pararhizobium sp. YC-54]|uniref:glycosyltransferase family protein n=1 Tax=Pararhizobium sp. YC-54 TaxID=2986920 RepID=UPI0021F7EC17|nr:glycosyltransferase [Pararhizobium sp. YC-54]MCW0000929.1 glycosyl transferase [Pararhizobium sp. YC-54]